MVIRVPANGAAYRINNLKEVKSSLSSESLECFVHEGTELELYCLTCKESICWRCVINGSRRHSHEYEDQKLALDPRRPVQEAKKQQLPRSVGTPPGRKAETTHISVLTSIVQVVENFKTAYGITLSQKAEIMVSEEARHCISVFDPRLLAKVRSFGSHGSNKGQFHSPCGIAVDGKGNVFVADRGNHRIQKFTEDGHFLKMVGSRGSSRLQFNSPEGIAVYRSGDRVYVVDANDHVQVLKLDLTFVKIFGKHGSGDGQFHSPHGIACDSTGKVYVADSGNHRIQIFTADGKFLKKFGVLGEGRGGLRYPFGVALDCYDRVFVSEFYNHRVQEFTSNGRFVNFFGKKGEGPGKFTIPRGIVVDCDGNVLVCDGDFVHMFACLDTRETVEGKGTMLTWHNFVVGFAVLVFIFGFFLVPIPKTV